MNKGLRPFPAAVFATITSLAVLVLSSPLLSNRAAAQARNAGKKKGGPAMTLKVTSPAFAGGSMIPVKYTCDGENVSPPLNWSGAPSGTKSLALVCDDPDAPSGEWVHWVLFNIPPLTRSLGEAVTRDGVLADGSRQGVNDFRKTGYDGPCPPGGTHRYYFKVYALGTVLNLAPGAAKADLMKAMNGQVLAEGHLMGLYRR